MRYTELWIPTLRESPKEAVAKSHILMLRAGYIFKQSSGVYGYLPLGWKVLQKVYHIIGEEIERIGGQWTDFPILVPRALWEKTGRYQKMGKGIFSLEDRHDQPFLLGPTHEESMVELLKSRGLSYKQFPINLFQIEKKFRDEIRPRYGVMRGREFMMLDGYSFHMTLDDLERVYQLYRLAYRRIFARMGLHTIPVRADSGDMGGEGSEEFMVPNAIGDDIMFSCEQCSYMANKELAAFFLPLCSFPPMPEGEIATPQIKDIPSLAEFLGVSLLQTAKTVVYRTGTGRWILVMIRGDLTVNEVKLSHLVQDGLFYEEDTEAIEKNIGPVGFLGAKDLHIPEGGSVFVDRSLIDGIPRIVGMNKRDFHYQGYVFSPSSEFQVGDFAEARDGDICPQCQIGTLHSFAGIEVGHIFQLGNDYTKKMEFSVLNEKGIPIFPLMGCYGIGVDRSLAAVIEQEGNETGFVLPSSISPYDVLLISIGKDCQKEGQEVYQNLKSSFDILWDDRDVSAGIKFNDAELLGIPIRVTLGKRFQKEGLCGVQHHKFSEGEEFLPIDQLKDKIQDFLNQEQKECQNILDKLEDIL